MRYLLPLLILIVSCSSPKRAQYHYKRALANGLKVMQSVDTIQIATIDSIPVIKNDTIIWEKIITKKDTFIQKQWMWVPKTKWQTRIEYRYKTKLLKQDVLKYKYIYREAKEQRKAVKISKIKTNFMLFVYGLLAGIVLSFVLRLLNKLYNPLR